jgi:cytidine deaminase
MDEHVNRQLDESVVADLVLAAQNARRNAYTPYSHFPVGAALRAADGTVYTGSNVENASFGLTICAERNAVFHAVSEGARDIEMIAVVTANGVTPCGACRQVLAEFNVEMQVIVADTDGNWRVYGLAELLPDAFVPEQLQKD